MSPFHSTFCLPHLQFKNMHIQKHAHTTNVPCNQKHWSVSFNSTHDRINEWMNEWMNEWFNQSINQSIFINHYQVLCFSRHSGFQGADWHRSWQHQMAGWCHLSAMAVRPGHSLRCRSCNQAGRFLPPWICLDLDNNCQSPEGYFSNGVCTPRGMM